ncbi:unnamed protein product [Porites lobata]|uniref:Uncharacterized protein n=1 Tax=Porites lobata TaxID=104759 RepID=A0ABN8PGS2_9CNID|nr:unnamed protein product [Porites lobata]
MWRRHKCNLLTSSHYLLQQVGSRDQCEVKVSTQMIQMKDLFSNESKFVKYLDIWGIWFLNGQPYQQGLDHIYLDKPGTSLLRQTLLPHCEQGTIHGVTFRMPSWASLRDLVELFPLGGLCPLADKLP